MTILITGGTGKTGTSLANRVQSANIPFLVASRSGKAPAPFVGVAFDWLDPTTFRNPFNTDKNIDRIFLIVPPAKSQAIHVKEFIDLAREKGVKRFVLLGASRGDLSMTGVRQYLIDIKADYAVLHPTWFHQNFGTTLLGSIRDNNETFSATGNGRIAFVSTDDIAEVAFEALTAEHITLRDRIVLGPELYSHDEVAKLFTTILGREITHRKFTVEELTTRYLGYGLPEEIARALPAMEGEVAKGAEEAIFNSDDERKYVGKRTLKEYILSNRDLWIKQ